MPFWENLIFLNRFNFKFLDYQLFNFKNLKRSFLKSSIVLLICPLLSIWHLLPQNYFLFFWGVGGQMVNTRFLCQNDIYSILLNITLKVFRAETIVAILFHKGKL